MKKKTIAALVNDAAAILQRIVRIKASDDEGYCTCVTCGVTKHYKEMDGGHWISRTSTMHKLREENIHPQCKRCNGFKGGEHQVYTLFMIDTYGREFVDHMIETKGVVKKYTRPEITQIIQDLKQYERDILKAKHWTF